MADVYDRWHKSKPGPGEPECPEHKGKVASADHGKGKRWQVRYRDASGIQRKENFTKKTEADDRADDVGSELRKGLFVDPKLGKQSFRVVAEQWRENSRHRDSTAVRVRSALENRIYPTLGDRPIAAIRTSEIRGWVKELSEVIAPTTLRVDYSYIGSIFRMAMIDRLISVNPCAGVDNLPEVVHAETEPLPVPVVEALIQAIDPRYGAALRLDACTGLRQGELFGLEVEQLDFLRRELKIRQQLVYPEHDKPYLGPLKTKTSYRTVPVPQFVVDEIAEHIVKFPPRNIEIWDRTNPHKPVLRKARFLFTNHAGRPILRGRWPDIWAATVRKANTLLAGQADRERAVPLVVPDWATLHDIRHFYASVLIDAGESVKTVQRRLGHSKPSITLDVYSHLWPEAEDTSRAAVEAAFGRSVPKQSAPKVPSRTLKAI
ncbi:MAG TPA: site-specific integrase [Actinocrinis sp.]|uniref:tyrosine-type recombinase/integrase n=1 Tax=Actinocrinis sp. TaxID=1920516 RepID=UPI002DDD1A5C|nr:site-specific integrase [Actinocrinis sp.]HEV2347402.1 site-specific integrase [Actinocrinis sp.]